MNCTYQNETGITFTVQTLYSHYSLLNIIEIICEKKISGIVEWLQKNRISTEKCLIIGSYLTGMRLANYLCDTSHVTVLDIYPHLQGFLNPDVTFVTSCSQVREELFDIIIDTSGLGGINPKEISTLKTPDAFIVEDPCSDGSDDYTRKTSTLSYLLKSVQARYRGTIFTSGLYTKTSGTMTLTMEVIKKSMDDALIENGVLYSSSYLDFFERILFKEKNPDKFFSKMTKPALMVSSLQPVDVNQIINNNLKKIESHLYDWTNPSL